MRKLSTWIAVAVAVAFFTSAGMAAPPDKMTIKEIQKSKGAVAYNHKAHAEKVKNCKTCHHMDAAGKEQGCGKCHGAKTEGKKVALKEAFHTQCKDCHKKEGKGPQKCDECHAKK
jgi:uncharacterized paraquat-inducible protein A